MRSSLIIFAAVLSAVLLVSCGAKEPAGEIGAGPEDVLQAEADAGAGAAQNTLFGTYTVPEGWVKSPELSSDVKTFYLKEGTSLDAPTSNISVEYGENRYAEAEHESFREAILQQLLSQAGEGGTVSGGGSHTENGLIVYVFTIESPEEVNAITTKQYYIIGEYRYAFIHETDFHDEAIPDVDEAAQEIVNSFQWQEH